ncbi:D-alanine-D-alanine ligase [Propionibacterium cyclohexanicum]|uniref:D-alanine--D-alanine ligase n=1 Tax=Propionibacterium cyclohexanicum TaxID=64702 RepID=A0A1H9QTV9_9ACTN|nr:D-alanine--D-alanine ligase family protein [Propionibacterium cyclohexanicum]SER63299.1 D-alanine-D-alanine ligase [Propionibacterium cyclohexanicum]
MPGQLNERISIAVVFGGQSTEHEVSCLTAAAALGAMDTSRYEVHGIGIDKSGIWHRYRPEEIRALQVVGEQLPVVDPHRPAAVLVRGAEGVRLASIDGQRLSEETPIDLAFPLMHGAYAEDGTIEGYFEMLGLRYVGCGVTSSAIGMDKQFMRICFQQAGIPVGPWLAIGSHQWPRHSDELLTRIREELRFPVYVKPSRGGSSVGIARVAEPQNLPEAIEHARRFDPKVIVEQGIVGGREVECAVLEAVPGEPQASVPGEIAMHANDGFYDYKAKYLPHGEVELRVPAPMDDAARRRVQELAVRCFTALDCEGLARVDLFLMPDGEVFVNEINTLPGFTALSMYPSLWRASGIEYPQLIDRLIDAALARPSTVLR